MIPVDSTQTIDTAGQSRSIGRVTISARTIPFLINAVTDRIYKDKPGAITREYPTNAWDAHIRAKLPISEIVITLPTIGDPVFRIRDFGAGLTMEEIRDIYCILGESTKRGSNEEAGQLGLGCKSGFAYGDSFTVTAWIDGKKSIYNLIKGDDTKEGDVFLVAEMEMAEGERTGIEVAIPIKICDIYVIHRKACDFFRHWVVLPNIQRMNETELSRMMNWRNTTPFLSGDGWEIRPSEGGQSLAVMGPVAYPIDWAMLRSKLALTPQKRQLLEILQSNQIVLTFPIGALKFTINREELEYTDTTYLNLETKVEAMFAALEGAVVERFANANGIWDAKRIYLSLFGKNSVNRKSDDESESTSNAIRVLDGEFYRLEEVFKGKLFWNGIPIDSPHFSKMHQWDVDRPGVLCEGNPFTPCLISYRKKKSRAKKLRCTSEDNNWITPYDGVQVVIMDGRNVSMTQTVARYYLLRENSTVTKVHILRFADDNQKKAFFEHYNFDTAEFVNVSDILGDVKAWQKNNRQLYSRGGSGGAVTKLKYINVKTGNIEEEDVALRDLEEGGVFVAACRRNAVFSDGRQPSLKDVADNLRILNEYFGEELDRVYCIPDGKLTAKWFQRAKDEGAWVDITAFVKENVEVVITDEMRREYHYQHFIQNQRYGVINDDWMNALVKELNGVSPEFNTFAAEKMDAPKDYEQISSALAFFGLHELNFGTSSVDYKGLMKNIQARYPLLRWLAVDSYNVVDNRKRNAIVEYIKSVEATKNDLTPAPETV